MKSILLTTTALVAFAGAAAAEAHMDDVGTNWAADGEFGYNEEVEGGFYFAGGLAVQANAALNADITAGVMLDVDLGFSPNTFGETGTAGSTSGAFDNISIDGSDFVIFVRSDTAALYIGDTATAAEKTWSGTTNMEADGFLEVGDVDDGPENGDFVDGVMRGDLTIGAVEMSVSYFFGESNNQDTTDDLDGLAGLQVGGSTTFGNFTVGGTYQEGVNQALVNAKNTDTNEDGITGDTDLDDNTGNIDELFGVFASTNFAGADVKVAYARNVDTEASSTGIEVGYPFGPVSLGAFYSLESDGDDATDEDDNYGVSASYATGAIAVTGYYHDGQDQETGIEGSYTLGNGLALYAGYIDNRDDIDDNYEAYAAATYDLGGGASLIAAYGDSGDNYGGANDEIGNAFEVNEGTTVAVSFSF